MERGLYTAASGMLVQQHRMDIISNNLANINTTGYKKDNAISKAFPELLLRRTDEHWVKFPYRARPSIGAIDKSPVLGKIGTGVELNEVYTVMEQGALKNTGNPTDIALHGNGFLVVDTPYGERYTRNGNFILGNGNILMTKEGYPVLGEKGYIRLQKNNFRIAEDGSIFINQDLASPEYPFVDARENDWRGEVLLDRFQSVDFELPRYLKKQGSSLWKATEYSGEAQPLENARPTFLPQYLEASNVEPVRQMVAMIEVNRSYEAGQKVIQSEDDATAQLISTVLKA